MEQEKAKGSFTKQAAKASWIIPLICLGVMAIGNSVFKSSGSPYGSLILGGVVILLFIIGIIFGIIGIFGVRQHGPKSTIVPSVIGIILNGAFIFLLISISMSAYRSVSSVKHPPPSSNAMIITISPNPCDVHSIPGIHEEPYPYMWYYRIEVKNMLSVPLQITWFAAYALVDDDWVLGETFNADVFASWYTEGDPCPKGIIQPGQTAVCDPSMQGSTDPTVGKSKWAYSAIDPDGQEYYAESVVEIVPFNK
jgi:hypothetical protein